MGTAVGRQLLRRRRPFTATVFTPDGSQIICRVRRPFYFINVSAVLLCLQQRALRKHKCGPAAHAVRKKCSSGALMRLHECMSNSQQARAQRCISVKLRFWA